MTTAAHDRIETLVKQNKVLVFMKGNKLMPQCGFSNNVVQILNTLGVPFETVDVLADAEIRQGVKEYSNWPTIPQVYIGGEFIGGSDIIYSSSLYWWGIYWWFGYYDRTLSER